MPSTVNHLSVANVRVMKTNNTPLIGPGISSTGNHVDLTTFSSSNTVLHRPTNNQTLSSSSQPKLLNQITTKTKQFNKKKLHKKYLL